MTQPKTPPISIRLPATLIAELDAWAGDYGMNRNASIVALLRHGLGTPLPSADPVAKGVTTDVTPPKPPASGAQKTPPGRAAVKLQPMSASGEVLPPRLASQKTPKR